jgi:hypothetical protein
MGSGLVMGLLGDLRSQLEYRARIGAPAGLSARFRKMLWSQRTVSARREAQEEVWEVSSVGRRLSRRQVSCNDIPLQAARHRLHT